MNIDKRFFEKEDFHGFENFKNFAENYKIDREIGFGVFALINDTNKVLTINKTKYESLNINTKVEELEKKLTKNPHTLLIGIPQVMYSTKYDLYNEIFQLYSTGLRLPSRIFFGKAIFALENFQDLKVCFKNMSYDISRSYYSSLLKTHKKNYDSLPFANMSDRIPKRLRVVY